MLLHLDSKSAPSHVHHLTHHPAGAAAACAPAGLAKLGCDSLEKLKAKLPALRAEMQDPDKYRQIYNFAYLFCRWGVVGWGPQRSLSLGAMALCVPRSLHSLTGVSGLESLAPTGLGWVRLRPPRAQAAAGPAAARCGH